jgi:hypothetical protein
MTGIQSFRWEHAVGALALVLTVAGCSRSGLRAHVVDGGSSSAGPEASPDQAIAVVPEAGPESGPESGPEPAREVGLEPRPESGPEVARETVPEGPDAPVLALEGGSESPREAPLEGPGDRPVTPESGWEGGVETPSEAGSACPGAVTVAKTLAEIDGQALPSALALQGDHIFAGVTIGGTGTVAPTGAIVAVSLTTGEMTTFPLGGNLPNQIVAAPGALFYIQGKVEPTTDGWRFDYTDVARLDLATGQVSIVDSEVVEAAVSIESVVANPSSEVYWSMLTDLSGASVIKRWDPVALTTQTVLSWGKSLPLLIDADHFYWSELDTDLHTLFMSMPSPSGPIFQVYRSPDAFPDAPSLTAVDDQSLYAVATGSVSPGILAMPKTGGDSRMVVAGANPILLDSHTIDDKHVYWVDQSNQSSVRRAPKAGGGPTEAVWSGSSALSGLAVDGCNVYWTVSGPTRLMVKGK